MSEFIGSRISLISKSDIRYVGTLHEINSENSTVALENVTSFGTEGRKNDPDAEIPGSDSVYEYIVFRGGDVKDLRIEEPPKENKPPPPPQVPNDPAILGSGSRPPGANGQPPQMPPTGPRHNNHFPPGPPFPNHYQGPPPFGAPYGPPGRGFPGYGPPPPPYGGPGGWHGGPPPPGAPGFQGPPGHFNAPFSPQQPNLSFGGPGPQQLTHERQQPSQGAPPQAQQPGKPPGKPAPTQPANARVPTGPALDKKTAAPAAPAQNGPPPPIESKPDLSSATAPSQAKAPGQKANRIVPAVPHAMPGAMKILKPNQASAPTTVAEQLKQPQAAANAALQHQNATTQAATAAVAAAMAKLNNANANVSAGSVDNLTEKVNDMRMDDRNRNARGRGRGRGGRGGARGIEVPTSDFDFESANAKFDKSNLAKTANSGSPIPAADGAEDVNGKEDVVIPPAEPAYSKDSFFDSLSREDGEGARKIVRGPEFRRDDRRLNMETFGMSSVDYGRGGYRGRGRGRGWRGRGGRGGRGNFQGQDSSAPLAG